jgi:hypothetical protein
MAKKKKTRMIEVCKNVGERIDVQNLSYSIPELLSFIKRNTPEGVKEEDIQLSFESEEEPYYYDETINHCYMSVVVREMKELNVR